MRSRARATYNSAIVRRRIAVLLCALALPACGGPASQLRAEQVRLDDELARVRAELRREKRKTRDLETENLVLRDKLETRTIGAARVGAPELPVEVLAPDEPPAHADLGDDVRVVATTDDGTEIVYVGDAATGRTLTAPDDLELADADDLALAPDDDEPLPPPPPRAKKKPAPARGDQAAAAYEAAYAKVRAKDRDGAISALRAFLADHPRHDLADNAQYWLGEVYYDAKDYPRAIVEFRATVEQYPRGNKVPDALLKMGYCFVALGQTTKARAALEQVIDTYPRTAPADLAARKLAELR